jgi:putative flippase GtrA
MIGQFLRYSVVGLASNLLLYLGYLGLTHLGVGHKLAMTVLYAVGVCFTFAFNRNWTFKHQGQYTRAFVAYVAVYFFGYLLNLAVLYLLVDRWGYPHQWVQGFMILFLAVLLFTLQKLVVFRSP